MSIETINIGNIANDGTGDDLRSAFIKVNNNFNSLNGIVNTTAISAANLGSETGVFAQKSDNTLQFKSLRAGYGVTLSNNGTSITITGNPGLESLITVSDNGSIILSGGNQTINVQGGTNTETRVSNKTIYVDVVGTDLVKLDPSPTLNSTLNANNYSITGAQNISAVGFTGDLTGLVHGIDIRTISDKLVDVDLGTFSTVNNVLDLILINYDFDLGTFASPSSVLIDGSAF
tara:strand:+ start:229 stop:924 length:696 start_codon:yes stop_codon:yes gene_type:complete